MLSAGLLASRQPTEDELVRYMQWVAETGRDVASQEEMNERAVAFADRLKSIEEHNRRFAAGHETSWQQLNQYADKTPAEIDAILGRDQPAPPTPEPAEMTIDDEVQKESSGEVLKGADPADTADHSAYMTAVKNMGDDCKGGGWVYSAVGLMEQRFVLEYEKGYIDNTDSTWNWYSDLKQNSGTYKKQSLVFSEQQILDCVNVEKMALVDNTITD